MRWGSSRIPWRVKRGDKLFVRMPKREGGWEIVPGIARTPNYESIEDIRGAKWTVYIPDRKSEFLISYNNMAQSERALSAGPRDDPYPYPVTLF